MSAMTNGDACEAIADMLADYGHLIDADKLEEWLDFFVEDSVYKILPRENVVRGLPLSLMLCENKNMIRDRITSLRKANIYNIHVDRHVIGRPRIVGEADGIYSVEANYAVFQTDQDGMTRIFSVGQYVDKVIFLDDGPKFKEKVVVVDTAAVQTLLATPL